MLIFLVEIGCLIAGVQSTLRFSRDGYQTQPADTPANTTYAPHLRALSFGFPIADDPFCIGQGTVSIANTDGEYDALLDYVYDSQTVRVLVGNPNAAYSAFKELSRWVVEQPSDGDTVISFVLKTSLYNLDRSMQTSRYGGTGGVDGGAELTNKPKPLAMGFVLNAKPILVDAVKLIYQLTSDHGLQGGSPTDAVLDFVTDEGVAATAGADYTSVAQMLSTAPTGADDYRVCNATASGATYDYGVYVRFQSQPIDPAFSGLFFTLGGVPTAATALQAFVAAASPGSLFYSGGGGGDALALATTFPQFVAMFFGSDGEPATFLDALRQVLRGMRGWIASYQAVPTQYPANGNTPWAARWLDTPATATPSPYGNDLLGPTGSVTPFLSVDGSQIVKPLSRLADYEFGWPEFRVTLLYDRFSYVQTQGLAGASLAYDRARYALEYLSASDEDLSVLTSFPTAVDQTIATAWNNVGSNVPAEATRQLGVFSEHHPTFQCSVRADLYHAALTVPGDPMEIVNYARHGCDTSRTFLILGHTVDFLSYDEGDNTVAVELSLWG